MNALRTVQQVHDGQIHLHLPKQFWGQQVEIIVLSAAQQEERQEAATSQRGCLRQYAIDANHPQSLCHSERREKSQSVLAGDSSRCSE